MSQTLKRKLRPACININQVEDESTSKNCQIHYTLKLADLYEVKTSIKGSASTCLNSIVTIIRSSDSGTEVKVLFRIPNKKTLFVNFNFPAVKLNELNFLDLQILADIQGSIEIAFCNKFITRQIDVPSSDSTTHVAVMFVIDIQKEMVKGIKPVEQKIKYFYASGLLNEQLQKSLTEQLCLPSVNESLMSPTINIPRHPLALIAQNNSSSLVPYSEHRPSIVTLHYELLLDDHYTAKTKCQFDCSSEEAVMSVITCLEASSSETVVEVFFIKKDNQVSFVRYVFHELKTKDLKQLNFNLSHTSLAGEKTFQKHFLLPRTMYTRNIKMALAFPLNNPNDMEPKVVYIYLKDVKNLQDTAEECSPESSNSDHEQSNSTQFNQQNEIHKENSAVGEHCQDNLEYKAKETKLPLHSPKEVKPTSQDHFSFNFLIEKPNDSSSTEPETMSDLKKMGETLCKTIIKTMKENFNLDLFNISTMGSTTTTKQIIDPKVTVNMFQINNNISCSIDKVKNAVVGGGNLYCSMVSENSCSNSHPAMDQ